MRLVAPLTAFGGEAIDARGVIRDFPAQSMLTGLFANALGWTRVMTTDHQRLQDRIVFGALWEDEASSDRMTDYQTVQLGKADKTWTTRGSPMGRLGGINTYKGSHQRYRDYHADLRMSVIVRLHPEDEPPTLADLAASLDRPARALFIGRKPCLPSRPLFTGWVKAPDARAALRTVAPGKGGSHRACWPASEGDEGADRTFSVTDERNWLTGLHGGARRICEGRFRVKEGIE